MSFRIVIIGAGNVASHLSKRLQVCGFNIVQVYSRSESSARELGQDLQVPYTTGIHKVDRSGDFYLLALKDSAIESFLKELHIRNKILVHCSGSLSLDMLLQFSTDAGVMYPLQTFSKNRDISISSVPFFLEASNGKVEYELWKMAHKLSDHVFRADSLQRKRLHISAVFSCNFVNHMYSIAAQLLEEYDLDFNYLMPLIHETTAKVAAIQPHRVQTGPAIRNDSNIMEMHYNELAKKPEIAEIYSLLSKHIYKFHKK
jgi:predicted short-subunit dehydrogenase-like oxidoreductase (DUF2520 family)